MALIYFDQQNPFKIFCVCRGHQGLPGEAYRPLDPDPTPLGWKPFPFPQEPGLFPLSESQSKGWLSALIGRGLERWLSPLAVWRPQKAISESCGVPGPSFPTFWPTLPSMLLGLLPPNKILSLHIPHFICITRNRLISICNRFFFYLKACIVFFFNEFYESLCGSVPAGERMLLLLTRFPRQALVEKEGWGPFGRIQAACSVGEDWDRDVGDKTARGLILSGIQR